ncbi:MAG TPA: YciI family protein [Chitinophagaceae bacterium]|nr:YciI family protein [Chitinophagaceae bacterium]
MKKLFLLFACFITVQLVAQNDTKDKKAWLGVLTLPEKFQDEKNWTAADQAIVGEHFQRLVKKKEEGVVVLAGRTELPLNNPEMMGLVVFYAKDEKEAMQFMMDDPAVKAKIMQAKVHPYGLAVSKCQ